MFGLERRHAQGSERDTDMDNEGGGSDGDVLGGHSDVRRKLGQ